MNNKRVNKAKWKAPIFCFFFFFAIILGLFIQLCYLSLSKKIYGKDMKQFAKNYLDFILDVCKYGLAKSFSYIKIPNFYEQTLKGYSDVHISKCVHLLDTLVKLDSEIKWNTSPKELVESTLVLECVR